MLAGAICVVVAAIVLVGCGGDANEAFIQGSWQYGVPGVGGVAQQSAVHTSWVFEDGTVMAHSCCEYRPGITGKYRIVESEDDLLVLEIYDIENDTDLETYQVEIAIDREHVSLTIQNAGPFIRVGGDSETGDQGSG